MSEMGALTIHRQNFSQMVLGGGSSYVSAITWSKPVIKSISSTLINLLFMTRVAPMNRNGASIRGR